jgi:high-affinity iron transporter
MPYDSYFNVAISTVFAREFLEGAVILVNYRSVIQNSDHWKSTELQRQALREVTKSAVFAVVVGVLVVVAVAIPLAIFSDHLSANVIAIIEGVSKLVAAVCIMQLSLKIPLWLGLYERRASILPCHNASTTILPSNFSQEEDENQDIVSVKEI